MSRPLLQNGDTEWNRNDVTFNNFTEGKHVNTVFNQQMIIDIVLPKEGDSPLRIHIPRPVIQRMIDGQTFGIALYPLGALHASFYLDEDGTNSRGPTLYMNLSDN